MQANRTYLEPYQVAPFQQPEFFDDVMEGRMPMTDLLQVCCHTPAKGTVFGVLNC